MGVRCALSSRVCSILSKADPLSQSFCSISCGSKWPLFPPFCYALSPPHSLGSRHIALHSASWPSLAYAFLQGLPNCSSQNNSHPHYHHQAGPLLTPLPHLLPTTLCDRFYYCSLFTDVETEAQKVNTLLHPRQLDCFSSIFLHLLNSYSFFQSQL